MGPGEALIPITFFLSVAAVFISRGEIGRAIAHAIRARSGGAATEQLETDLAELRADFEQMRQQLLEAHERLDFAERLLSQQRLPDQLPKG